MPTPDKDQMIQDMLSEAQLKREQPQCTGPFSDARDCPVHSPATRRDAPQEQIDLQAIIYEQRDHLADWQKREDEAGAAHGWSAADFCFEEIIDDLKRRLLAGRDADPAKEPGWQPIELQRIKLRAALRMILLTDCGVECGDIARKALADTETVPAPPVAAKEPTK